MKYYSHKCDSTKFCGNKIYLQSLINMVHGNLQLRNVCVQNRNEIEWNKPNSNVRFPEKNNTIQFTRKTKVLSRVQFTTRRKFLPSLKEHNNVTQYIKASIPYKLWWLRTSVGQDGPKSRRRTSHCFDYYYSVRR